MNTFAVWFHRLIWVGILANLALALPGLFATERLLAWLALEPASPVLWPRFASLLLILLSLFYIPAAVNLYTHRANAWLAVLSRFAGVVFFFVHAGDYILFGVFDLIFGLPQAILLMLALRAQRQPVALTAPKQRRARHCRRAQHCLAGAWGAGLRRVVQTDARGAANLSLGRGVF